MGTLGTVSFAYNQEQLCIRRVYRWVEMSRLAPVSLGSFKACLVDATHTVHCRTHPGCASNPTVLSCYHTPFTRAKPTHLKGKEQQHTWCPRGNRGRRFEPIFTHWGDTERNPVKCRYPSSSGVVKLHGPSHSAKCGQRNFNITNASVSSLRITCDLPCI